jgi:NADH-quinone oxidoreductase subunit L
MYTSLFTIFCSGLVASIEIDIKKIIAISTLSQLALIIFVTSIGEIELSFYHLINHALFKALLFLRCGISIIRLYGNQDARNRSGITKKILFIPFFFVISNINLMGFPFISAYYSKDQIIEST